jgi:hypothetical protein
MVSDPESLYAGYGLHLLANSKGNINTGVRD